MSHFEISYTCKYIRHSPSILSIYIYKYIITIGICIYIYTWGIYVIFQMFKYLLHIHIHWMTGCSSHCWWLYHSGPEKMNIILPLLAYSKKKSNTCNTTKQWLNSDMALQLSAKTKQYFLIGKHGVLKWKGISTAILTIKNQGICGCRSKSKYPENHSNHEVKTRSWSLRTSMRYDVSWGPLPCKIVWGIWLKKWQRCLQYFHPTTF